MAITWNIDEARATIRAQMAEANRLDEVIDDLSAETSAALARAEAAEAEVGRLQAALDQWKQRGDAIMLCATGRAAPLSDWDDKGYAHVMAVFDRAAAAIIPQDPRCWADWVVYLLEALDANGEIETRGYDFYAVLRSLQDAINERKLNGRW